ncbi:hypothetical protein N9832_04010 [Amylibacter sp.]|jgi:hypothetical protein|nr:hypothetical protein [Amylibacter sp.]MDB4245469.1 hypothetical protein [Amylibacter sp.]
MEMPIDQEDFDNEIFETLTSLKSQDAKRYCPKCNNIVVGRANKKFCTSNCRKRHSEPKRNSQESPTKRRENAEFFDRALRLAEDLYSKPPAERDDYMKVLIDIAREGKDARLRDILTNYRLLHIHPFNDRHLLHRRNPEYFTITQYAFQYCFKYWKAHPRLVVYNRIDHPIDRVPR